MPKRQCFVIQPFDDDSRRLYEDTIRPAIEAAGLAAYRVDKDPSAQKLIDSIEENIRASAICVADITTDNPNVWYEVGFAFAAHRTVVLISSKDRHAYPFDIQHRNVVRYGTASKTDFVELSQEITRRCVALLEEMGTVDIAAQNRYTDRVSKQEERILRAAQEAVAPEEGVAVTCLKRDGPRDISTADFHLALWLLVKRGFMTSKVFMHQEGYPDRLLRITDAGWSWLSQNTMSPRKEENTPSDEGEPTEDDDIAPF